MLSSYKWPGKYRPFSHQVATTEFLIRNKKAFCFNEAGTGKTACVIWATDFLLAKKAIRRVLIVCPLSITNAAWRADLFMFAMHRSVVIAHGSAEKRKQLIAENTEYVIINFDGVGTVLPELMDGGFDLVVIDECTSYKSSTTRRFKTMLKLMAKIKGLWMLTGTPAAQSPTDAYALAKLVCPERVPKFFGAFRDIVMYKAGPFKWLPREHAKSIVFDVLQPAIRFEKRQCLDLPPVTHIDRDVPMSVQQATYYKQLKTQMIIESSGQQVTAVNAAAHLTKLLQLACGSVYTDDGKILEFDASGRLSVLKEVIDETSNKVLVFVPYTHAIAKVQTYLLKAGIVTEVISGAVSSNARNDIVQRFQTRPDTKVLVLQPRTAAHGLTLTEADTVVWYTAPIAGVETYLQSNARIDRQGQKNSMTVVHLKGSPVEERLYKALRENVDLHVSMVELFKQEIEEKGK